MLVLIWILTVLHYDSVSKNFSQKMILEKEKQQTGKRMKNHPAFKKS